MTITQQQFAEALYEVYNDDEGVADKAHDALNQLYELTFPDDFEEFLKECLAAEGRGE